MLSSSQGQLGETQEQVKAGTPALPLPAGITRKASPPHQPLCFSPGLTLLTPAMAPAQELNSSAIFQHLCVKLAILEF